MDRPAPACDTLSVPLRLGPDSLGDLPMHATLGEAAAYCRGTSTDTVTPGGTAVLAIRIPLRGATLWAVSDADAYTESLVLHRRPMFWYATGDSLRFPNGAHVPRTVGDFRRRFPAAMLRADNFDDTEGSYVIACTAPQVTFILGHREDLNDTAATTLAARPLPDSATFWRIRIDTAGAATDPALAWICRRASVDR